MYDMGNVWLKPFLLLMFDSISLIFIKEACCRPLLRSLFSCFHFILSIVDTG